MLDPAQWAAFVADFSGVDSKVDGKFGVLVETAAQLDPVWGKGWHVVYIATTVPARVELQFPVKMHLTQVGVALPGRDEIEAKMGMALRSRRPGAGTGAPVSLAQHSTLIRKVNAVVDLIWQFSFEAKYTRYH